MRILITKMTAAVASLALTSGAAFCQTSDVTLRVACYGGVFTTIQKKYVADTFTSRTGIKVQFIDGNPSDHVAKLLASKGRAPPFDVVYLDDDIQANAIAAVTLEKLDPNIVTNLRFVYDEAQNTNGYGPGMLFYSTGIAYNVEKLKEAGIPEPTSAADLWNPKFAKRIAVPDISYGPGRDFLVIASRLNDGDERTLEKGIDKIAQLMAESYPNSSATLEALFQSGNVWVSWWVNGRAWGLIDKGAPLRYILPKEGGVAHMTTIDLVIGTPHSKEAQMYINMTLDPLAQLGQANEIPYGPTNRLLVDVMKAYPNLSKKFPASPQDIKSLYRVNWDAFSKGYSKAVGLWNRKVIK